MKLTSQDKIYFIDNLRIGEYRLSYRTRGANDGTDMYKVIRILGVKLNHIDVISGPENFTVSIQTISVKGKTRDVRGDGIDFHSIVIPDHDNEIRSVLALDQSERQLLYTYAKDNSANLVTGTSFDDGMTLDRLKKLSTPIEEIGHLVVPPPQVAKDVADLYVMLKQYERDNPDFVKMMELVEKAAEVSRLAELPKQEPEIITTDHIVMCTCPSWCLLHVSRDTHTHTGTTITSTETGKLRRYSSYLTYRRMLETLSPNVFAFTPEMVEDEKRLGNEMTQSEMMHLLRRADEVVPSAWDHAEWDHAGEEVLYVDP